MIQVLPDQHQLVLLLAFPLVVIEREALTAEVEDMPFGTFIKPENSLSPENRLRELIVEKILESFDGKRAIALKGDRGKAIDR
jgi:hypothetical protein